VRGIADGMILSYNKDVGRKNKNCEGEIPMNKNAEISKRIMNLINSGVSIRDAINTVLGAGAYEKMAGDIWETMRK
jgi:type II secretory pathway component PulF